MTEEPSPVYWHWDLSDRMMYHAINTGGIATSLAGGVLTERFCNNLLLCSLGFATVLTGIATPFLVEKFLPKNDFEDTPPFQANKYTLSTGLRNSLLSLTAAGGSSLYNYGFSLRSMHLIMIASAALPLALICHSLGRNIVKNLESRINI
ncbi:MAG TPA: hypothetical protein VJB87_05805 [Candidatus Nanoarchaeia archaeon]|nr:hypothetical protein [Candidatus Nanoarchaeia archaeon]